LAWPKAALRDAPKVLDLILFVLTAAGTFVPLGLLGLTAACQALFLDQRREAFAGGTALLI